MINAIPTTATVTSTTLGASQGTLPLTVTSPIDSAALSTSTVTVQGRTTPGASVTANGDSDVADANGNFSGYQSLSEPRISCLIAVFHASDSNIPIF